MYEHNALGYWSGLPLCLTKVRSRGARCPATALISFQFRKIITRYRRIGYYLDVMRRSACLVFNPIVIDGFAAFFNCIPTGRASDSTMAPT